VTPGDVQLVANHLSRLFPPTARWTREQADIVGVALRRADLTAAAANAALDELAAEFKSPAALTPAHVVDRVERAAAEAERRSRRAQARPRRSDEPERRHVTEWCDAYREALERGVYDTLDLEAALFAGSVFGGDRGASAARLADAIVRAGVRMPPPRSRYLAERFRQLWPDATTGSTPPWEQQ